jgi:hypothetical protein
MEIGIHGIYVMGCFVSEENIHIGNIIKTGSQNKLLKGERVIV